jgi:pimeloyl-ACP methyl ester carboxylesterase
MWLIPVVLGTACAEFQTGPQPGLKPEKYVKVGNEQIYVTEQGKDGPTVLLVHGYCGAADQWMMVQPTLARDYRVLAVDLPGFGRSDKYMGDYSTEAMAARMFALLDRKGTKEAHVVAHSWGTSIALAMALMHPERVKSLTLIGVWAYDEQLPPFLVWSQAPGLGEVLFTLFFDQRLDDRMGLSFYNVDAYIDPHAIDLAHEVMDRPGYMAAALAAVRGMRYAEMAKRYKTIKNRVLIIHGEYDPVTRLPWAKRLDSELPDSRLVVIRNAKHMSMFAAAPKVLRALRPFLAGLEPGQAVPRTAPPPAPRATPPPAPRPPASAPSLPPAEPEDEVLQ